MRSTQVGDLEVSVFTDRIRSMGEGNVFTRVCHSVHDGELPWGGGGLHGRGV